MMGFPASVAALIILATCIHSSWQLDYLSDKDKQSFVRVFESALSKPKDVPSLFYGIAGLKLLEQKIPDEQNYCDFVKRNVNPDDIESIFSAADVARRLVNCKLDNPEKLLATLTAGISEEQTTQNLNYIINSVKWLSGKADNAKFLASLAAAVKKDDSVQSLAYAFHAASRATGDLKPFLDRIEDVVAQADEVDGKFLQFEGGLSVTANAISGIYSLSEKNNKSLPMKSEEAVKFANFLMSRRGVQLPRPAYHLIRAIQFLVKNKQQVPLSVSLSSSLAVSSENPEVRVKVCDLMGNKVATVSGVVIQTATHEKTSGVVLSKAPLKLTGSSDQTEYGLNFLTEDRQEGFYSLDVAVQSSDKKLIGLEGKVKVKVLTEASIHNVEVAVTDRDQKTTSNTLNIQYPNKIPTIVEADFHQKLIMKFNLKNKKTQQPLVVQQAFVLFRNIDTKQEIIFVAEPDTNKQYKFDIDLFKSATDFDFLSGKYNMILVIGDAVLSNSFQWTIVDANLKFPPHERPTQVRTVTYEPRQRIKHQFRPAEKRPPRVLSNAFTALVLAPLALLLILWLIIGINFSNFLFSLYTLGFHIGLGAIFGLYMMFWMQLNMFQTVKYLAVIGLFTFLSGNAMLRRMAERRMEKKKAQ